MHSIHANNNNVDNDIDNNIDNNIVNDIDNNINKDSLYTFVCLKHLYNTSGGGGCTLQLKISVTSRQFISLKNS